MSDGISRVGSVGEYAFSTFPLLCCQHGILSLNYSRIIEDFNFTFFSCRRAASDIKRHIARCVSSASNDTRRPCVSSPCKFTKSELGRDYINKRTRNYEAACNIVFNHRFLVSLFQDISQPTLTRGLFCMHHLCAKLNFFTLCRA